MTSMLDPGQVLKAAYDDTTGALKTELISGGIAGTVAIKDGASNNEATVTVGGELLVTANTLALPTGAATSANQTTTNTTLAEIATDTDHLDANLSTLATSANQTTANTSLASIDTKTPALGQAAMAASTPVVIASNQSAVPASQSGTWNVRTQDGSGTALTSTGSALDVNLKTSSITLNTNATQSGTWNINNISGTVSLPTNAATSTKQSDGSQKTQIVDGSGNVIASTSNALNTSAAQSGTWNVRSQDGSGNALTSHSVNSNRGADDYALGYTASEFARNDYSSVNVTTSAYTQLIASTGSEYQEFEIFDSSGQTLKIAFGAPASEVDKFLVFPGGNGRIRRNVPTGTRISIKAVSATASTGEISLNLYG